MDTGKELEGLFSGTILICKDDFGLELPMGQLRYDMNWEG